MKKVAGIIFSILLFNVLLLSVPIVKAEDGYDEGAYYDEENSEDSSDAGENEEYEIRYEPITVNYIDDISKNDSKHLIKHTESDIVNFYDAFGYRNTNHYYRFVLDSPAYVKIQTTGWVLTGEESQRRIDETLSGDWYGCLDGYSGISGLVTYLYKEPQEGTEYGRLSDNPWYGTVYKTSDSCVLLDAGTYILEKDIYVDDYDETGESDGKAKLNSKSFEAISILAQPLSDPEAYSGFTMDMARELGKNERVNGAIGLYDNAQYYKLSVDQNGKIPLTINRKKITYLIKQKELRVDLLNESGTLLETKIIKPSEYSGNYSFDLSEGTYYVKVYNIEEDYEYDDFTNPGQEYSIISGTDSNDYSLPTPKLLTYKKGTKLIKGKGEEGTTVCVTVEGKKYTVKCKGKTFKLVLKKPLKKGKVIKVYARSGENKSKTRSYKVK